MTIKLIHTFFVISFMAGVLYLPRIVVYCKIAIKNNEPIKRLIIMGRKLFIFSIFNAIGVVITGIHIAFHTFNFSGLWIWLKLLMVGVLICYFLFAGRVIYSKDLDTKFGSHIFWRIYNELAVILLLIILYLVFFKPGFN